jgi:hypothetical protein
VKEVALICGLISGLSGVVSALAFLRGSVPMPREMESWDGETDPEKAFRTAAQWWNRAGQIALLLAFVFSVASSIASYYS